MSEKNSEELAQMRLVVERFLIDGPENRAKYETVDGKLSFLKSLLEQNVFESTDSHSHYCMGIVFGDALAKQCGMEWKMVEDEFGTDPCLQLPRVNMLLFPMTTISKRVKRSTPFDIFEMFNDLIVKIDDLKSKSDIRTSNFRPN